ncbi:unnamed protein product, partial [Linum tenue]
KLSSSSQQGIISRSINLVLHSSPFWKKVQRFPPRSRVLGVPIPNRRFPVSDSFLLIMSGKYVIGAIAASFPIAYLCDTLVSDVKIFGGLHSGYSLEQGMVGGN